MRPLFRFYHRPNLTYNLSFPDRVYVDDAKLTDKAKEHLSSAKVFPYNTTKFIDDIKAEGTKQSAKIWVNFTNLIAAGYN